jgi:hypothetical protein
MALKLPKNWTEVAAVGAGAAATVAYYDQVKQSAGTQRAIDDAVFGAAFGGLFTLFARQAGLLNDVSSGSWAGSLAWLIMNG